ncbi:MAG TPA: dual specificity protein phosphatase family protein [Isosphaeraceae bacterium]|jgi:hypothetical protein
MRLVIAFVILGLALAVLALGLARAATGAWWLLVGLEADLAACFLALAGLYAARWAGFAAEDLVDRPRWSPLVRAALLPYLGLAKVTLAVTRRVDREEPMNGLVPGLFIGRLPVRSERGRLAEAGIASVLNLCWEFPGRSGDAGMPGLATAVVPILDGAPPSSRQFREAVDRVERWRAEGRTVLIHCAQGHGRTATVAAAVLCRLGLASDAAAALARIRAVRPRARPSQVQREALERYLASNPGRPDSRNP